MADTSGIFSLLGNLGAGIQGSRMGKKQMELGQGMMDEAASISAGNIRPEMMTPEAIQLMMQLSQGRQFQNMPGMNMMQNQIGAATAGGVGAIERAGSGAEGMGAITDLYSNQMGQQQQIGIQNAAYKDQAQKDNMQNLNTAGEWEQKAWEVNEYNPYLQAQQKASQLDTAGRMGQWEGLKTKMGSWAESFQGMGGALDDIGSEAAGLIGKGAPGIGGIVSAAFGG